MLEQGTFTENIIFFQLVLNLYFLVWFPFPQAPQDFSHLQNSVVNIILIYLMYLMSININYAEHCA